MNQLTCHGVLPKTEDRRDLVGGVLFSLPKLEELPLEYEVSIPQDWILDQGQTDTCAGHAAALASSLQEGVSLDPLFTWIMARAVSNYAVDDFGVQVREIMLAHVKIGAIERSQAQYTVNDDPQKWRDISTWDVASLQKKAIVHKKGSAIFIDASQEYDLFDTIRATLWKFKDEKVVVVIGTHWPYPANVAQIDTWLPSGFGHAYVFNGWNKNGIQLKQVCAHGKTVNSWGSNVGDRGRFYIARDIINREVPTFGAGFFHDETPDKLRWYADNGVKFEDAWYKGLGLALFKFLSDLKKNFIQSIYSQPDMIPMKITKLAEGIREFEGYGGIGSTVNGKFYPLGTPSFRNRNAGNCRFYYGGYLPMYGDVKCSPEKFAVFPTEELGWLYLQRMLWNAAKVHPNMTLKAYIRDVYAPASDGNTPNHYSEWLAKRFGVEDSVALSYFLI